MTPASARRKTLVREIQLHSVLMKNPLESSGAEELRAPSNRNFYQIRRAIRSARSPDVSAANLAAAAAVRAAIPLENQKSRQLSAVSSPSKWTATCQVFMLHD